jgi:hypothetical protein
VRLRYLREADALLNKLRLYLPLAHRWPWVAFGFTPILSISCGLYCVLEYS